MTLSPRHPTLTTNYPNNMATKKKGCGFLISALVLLIIGGCIAGFTGLSAFNSGKEFVEKIDEGVKKKEEEIMEV